MFRGSCRAVERVAAADRSLTVAALFGGGFFPVRQSRDREEAVWGGRETSARFGSDFVQRAEVGGHRRLGSLARVAMQPRLSA